MYFRSRIYIGNQYKLYAPVLQHRFVAETISKLSHGHSHTKFVQTHKHAYLLDDVLVVVRKKEQFITYIVQTVQQVFL